MIEKTLPGVSPHRTITAPIQDHLDHTDEEIRQLYFRQSEETRDGKVAPFSLCDTQH
jgi:hypothetical protein